MTIDLLDAPLRVTWDLHSASGAMADGDARRVAAELGKAGVFFVTLDRRPLAHPRIREILGLLAEGGCRSLVICSGSEAELSPLGEDLHLHAIYLDASPFIAGGRADIDRLRRLLERLRQEGREPGLLMMPRSDNLRLILPLLDFCRAEGVGKFKLPNTRYDDSLRGSGADGLPRPEDLQQLARELRGGGSAARTDVEMEIHDLFLWELFFPDRESGRSEYGGCQAANSIGHVDGAGTLFPCSSWAEPLGSLLETSLAELWSLPQRHEVRREILRRPRGCSGCRDYAICLGGCRGLAEALGQDGSGRDLLCSGPR